MESLENEKLITESGNRQVMLTTHRLRYHEGTSSNSDFTSIMLDKISSIEVKYQSNILFLIIGVITIPIVVGIVFILIYYFTRKHVVSVNPDGGKSIIFETRGMKREYLEEFIFKIESASMKLKKM